MRFLIGAAYVAVLWMGAAQAETPHYHLAGRIPLAGESGWDYVSVDPATATLFIAHTDDATAMGLNLPHIVRSFGPVKHGHAVVPIDGGAELAVTSGADDTLKLFDVKSGRLLASIPVGHGPDGAIADPKTGNVLVMNGHGGTVSVVNPQTRAVVRSIKLQPGLEFPAVDRRGMLFDNNEELNQVDVADLATGKVSAPIALPGCTGPSGLAYDAATDRLIVACDNGKAAVVDASARRQVKLLDIGRGPDAVILDAKRRLAFIPCGRDGTLAVIALDRHDGPQIVQTVKTEPGARTGALDPATGVIYLPTARFVPQATPVKHPPIVPGSFHVLMVKPGV